MHTARTELVLLTGVSGDVGGRLVKSLERRGVRLRCLARRPEYVNARVCPTTEIVKGDVMDPASLSGAMQGVSTTYYLVHSMGDSGSFDKQDRQAAANFALAAKEAGVRRIIYLGALGEQISPHLASRQEVGILLRDSGVETIEFRASIIIGSGSLSFEMIRALVEKLPVMVTPLWVRNLAQPIAIEDVIGYLMASLDMPSLGSRVYEIGGRDQASYMDLMREYASQRKLKRLFLPVPLLTPWLSGLWLALITPLLARIGRKLIDSIRTSTVVTDESALRDFAVRPRGFREAIARALMHEENEFAQTRWSDAMSSSPPARQWGGTKFGNRLVDSRTMFAAVDPHLAFVPIRRLGGATGWYYGNVLWRLRGFFDRLIGGVGTRRGRRDPQFLHPGETVDFWRVEAVENGRLLRLYAEMRVPGRAWLQFEVDSAPGGAIIRQTAIFDPHGLTGLIYWYAMYPFHQFLFRGMLRNIVKAAVASEGTLSINAQASIPFPPT